MGSLFDDVTALAHRDRFESLGSENFSFSDQEARANRRLLHWLMTQEGFAGHPDEWWHFSWGDQLWAALTDAPNPPVMMLACPGLRVVPVTIHLGLRQALARLDTDIIVEQAELTATALNRDFAISRPRLAVAGLNPHAGEAGAMGDEEARIIVPAIERLRAAGIEVSGPESPDTLFTQRRRETYDAAICMYHDQALIPIKTLDFSGGVNITLGLAIVRTSPDHGTALDIAGTGRADPGRLLNAIDAAATIAANRRVTA